MEIKTINDKTLEEIASDMDDVEILWEVLEAIDQAVYVLKTLSNDCQRLMIRSIGMASKVVDLRTADRERLFDTVNAKLAEIEQFIESVEQEGGTR